MKIKNALISCLMSLLILTGCGPSNPSEAPSEIVIQNNGEKWPSNIKNIMMEVCHELIPFIELDGTLEVKILKNQRDEDILYIFEDSLVDKGRTGKYREIINSSNQYRYQGVDSADKVNAYYNYIKENEDGSSLVLRFGYFSGSEESSQRKGFEIYAYYMAPVNYVTEWTQKEKTMLLTHLQEMVPCPKLSDKHEMYFDEDIQNVVVRDLYMSSQIYDSYISTLLSNGFERVDDGTGFYTYDKETVNSKAYKISIDPYDFNKLGAVGVEIYYSRRRVSTKTTSWPKDEINKFFENDTDIKEIPSYDESDKYVFWNDEERVTVRAFATKESTDNYIELLRMNEYLVAYNEEFQTYIAKNFKENIALLIKYYPNNGIIDIEINKLEVPDNLTIVENWPSSKLEKLFGNVTIPLFVSNKYKVYETDSYIRIRSFDLNEELGESYSKTLKAAGYEVSFDTNNNEYTATNTKDGVKIVFVNFHHQFVSTFYKL